MDYKVGDTVKLKSGKKPMVIRAITPENLLVCCWKEEKKYCDAEISLFNPVTVSPC